MILTPSKTKTYNENHKLAKAIIYVIILLLVLPCLKEAFIVTLWFWGLNPIAYVIETIRGQEHQHDRI